jgi:hypothetical protein
MYTFPLSSLLALRRSHIPTSPSPYTEVAPSPTSPTDPPLNLSIQFASAYIPRSRRLTVIPSPPSGSSSGSTPSIPSTSAAHVATHSHDRAPGQTSPYSSEPSTSRGTGAGPVPPSAFKPPGSPKLARRTSKPRLERSTSTPRLGKSIPRMVERAVSRPTTASTTDSRPGLARQLSAASTARKAEKARAKARHRREDDGTWVVLELADEHGALPPILPHCARPHHALFSTRRAHAHAPSSRALPQRPWR